MKVLIAEDDRSLRQALELMVRSFFREASIESVTDGKRAWEAFQQAPDSYDLVMTDFKMPHMRGDELIEKIHQIRPGQKILLHSSDNMTAEAAKLGVVFAEKNTDIAWEAVFSRLGFRV